MCRQRADTLCIITISDALNDVTVNLLTIVSKPVFIKCNFAPGNFEESIKIRDAIQKNIRQRQAIRHINRGYCDNWFARFCNLFH